MALFLHGGSLFPLEIGRVLGHNFMARMFPFREMLTAPVERVSGVYLHSFVQKGNVRMCFPPRHTVALRVLSVYAHHE